MITGIRRAWALPVQREASLAGDFLQAPIASDQIFLLDVNVVLFLTGMFIETSASIIVLAPILGTRSLPFSARIAPATFAIGRNGLAGEAQRRPARQPPPGGVSHHARDSERSSRSTCEHERIAMPKFAANLTMMFNEVAFPERFASAARAGFRGVEFLFPYELPPQEVARLLRENDLQNALFNMPPGNWAAGERGMASLPGREEEFRAGVATAIEYALALGTPTVHALCGLLPPAADRDVHRAVYVDNLRHAARELARHGRTLVIEPINRRDIPGYFLNTQAEGHAICSAVGEPNIKVQMDFYHAQIVEGDLAITLEKYFKGIGHVQIASVPDRHEPDDGEVNYPYLFRRLDQLGYDGWVGCEYRPRGRTEDGLAWLREAS